MKDGKSHGEEKFFNAARQFIIRHKFKVKKEKRYLKMKKNLFHITFIILSFLFMHLAAKAAGNETGYDIKIKLSSYNNDTLLLGYQLG